MAERTAAQDEERDRPTGGGGTDSPGLPATTARSVGTEPSTTPTNVRSDGAASTSAATPRAREMRERILAAAREELAENGPTTLSMRSIARRLGVAVGGLYRYIDGRDALLTELIVDAYDGLGEAAERVVAQRPRTSAGAAAKTGEAPTTAGGAPTTAVAAPTAADAETWIDLWRAVRAWAIAHPHEFALVYGTPVIGYAAPERTVAAATRLLAVLAGLALAAPGPARAEAVEDAGLARDLEAVRAWTRERLAPSGAVDDARILGVLRAWTEGIGTIGFALHGHYVGSIAHDEAYLVHMARAQARDLGLAPGRAG